MLKFQREEEEEGNINARCFLATNFIRPLHLNETPHTQATAGSPLDLVLPRMGLDLAEPGALLMPSLSW